jgi:hypothetical protein
MTFECTHSVEKITLRFLPLKAGVLTRLLPQKAPDLDSLSPTDRKLAFALADLRALADETEELLDIAGDRIILSHRLAAALDADTASVLGLPQLTDLTLRTDAEGVLGTESFRLRVQWMRGGQQRMPARTGAILDSDKGPQRLPLWMLDALEVAEGFHRSTDDAVHWEALARFRRALEPGVALDAANPASRVSMTDFLSGLEVSLTDSFSISPDVAGGDFEVVPFALDKIAGGDVPVEAGAELSGADLKLFQRRLRERGALNAFRLGPGRFLVVDRAAAPALRVMADMQRATPENRRAFIRNPRTRITEAVEAKLRRQPDFAALTPAAQEEAIEAAAGPVLIETEEFIRFSERVTGLDVYRGNPIAEFTSSGTTWLPEAFAAAVLARLDKLETSALEALHAHVKDGIEAGQASVAFEGHDLPANAQTIQVLEARLDLRRAEVDTPEETLRDAGAANGPVILQTTDNFEEVGWRPARGPRYAPGGMVVPGQIRTRMKEHQVESLGLQIASWKAGMPGILNADEQGLGKTLQTIAFLVWLNNQMKSDGAEARGPILVVAPTSLLENWEQEVKTHVEGAGLGHLIRLYGSATMGRRRLGASGRDTENGEARLDFSDIERALESGAGHLTWVLTTYTTLTNYQHSLGKIPFAAIVFDEIQNIKNSGTLAANAARAMNADYRIGLTGTPIENATLDLWAIMDQLTPGALGAMRDFRQQFGTPDEDNMMRLHAQVFNPQGERPALAFRRMKETVARDLPTKSRFLHPRAMPPRQTDVYEAARVKLASGGPGAALKMLHHIRSVSVHPDLEARVQDADFIALSGRLSATFDILRRIRLQGARALVFIESRQMQYRFVELARAEFGLSQIDLINGSTPISKRQAIVNRFQRHLEHDGGFDMLVLGPKAAGTGLTLTAATHVIHLSRWWNPAVEEQCNDRVHRLGQHKPVSIHLPLAIHPGYREQSFDLLLQSLMQRKRRLASSALWPMGDATEDAEQLQKMLRGAADVGQGDTVHAAMVALFERDNIGRGMPDVYGAWQYP